MCFFNERFIFRVNIYNLYGLDCVLNLIILGKWLVNNLIIFIFCLGGEGVFREFLGSKFRCGFEGKGYLIFF